MYKYTGEITKLFHIPKCTVKNKYVSALLSCRNLSYNAINRVYQFNLPYNNNGVKKPSLNYVKSIFKAYRGYCHMGKDKGKIDLEDFLKREKDLLKNRKEEENAYNTEAENDITPLRSKILEAALLHVPSLGWTRNAIIRGAEDLGYSSAIHGAFPEGGFSLVSYFTSKCNNELVQQMRTEVALKNHKNGECNDEQVISQMEFLIRFVRIRLEMLLPYKNQWAQALSLTALPQNTPTNLAQLLTLVDDICYYSGDRSVDIAWYTRRIGLATIFRMTEFYLLQDNSPEHVKTWEFLKNRTYEMGQLQTFFNQTEDVTQTLQKSLNSAFLTARNILGLTYNRS